MGPAESCCLQNSSPIAQEITSGATPHGKFPLPVVSELVEPPVPPVLPVVPPVAPELVEPPVPPVAAEPEVLAPPVAPEAEEVLAPPVFAAPEEPEPQ